MLQKKKTQKSVYPQEVVKRAIELGAAAVILVLTVPSGAVELFRVFFFKQKTAYEVVRSDWSSDVCSSDLMPLSLMTLSLVDSPVTLQEGVKILERDDYRCQYCGLDGRASFENALVMRVDFVVPRARKG